MQQIEDKDELQNPLKELNLKKPYKKIELKEVPDQVLIPIEQIEDYLFDSIKEWDFEAKSHKDLDFQFPLPETIFQQQEGDEPLITFKEQTFDVEKLEVRDLSKQQFSDIYKNGTFIVPSQQFDIPYKWKVSDWIVLGVENIRNVFYYHIAHCNGHFRRIFLRFYNGTKNKCDVYKGVKALTIKPIKNIYALLLGKKYLANYSIESKILVEKQKQQFEAYQKKLSKFPLYQFLLGNENKKINAKNFQYFTEIVQEISKVNEEYHQKYFQNLSGIEKEDMFIDRINNAVNIPQDVKTQLFELLRAEKIIKEQTENFDFMMKFCPVDSTHIDPVIGIRSRNKKNTSKKGPIFGNCFQKFYPNDNQFQKFKRLNNQTEQIKYKEPLEKREQIEKNIRSQYPILGKHPGFKKKLLQQACESEYDFELMRKNQNIESKFKDENLQFALQMYQEHIDFHKKKESIEIIIEKSFNEPLQTHRVYYYYINPTEIEEYKSGDKTYYRLKQSIEYKISTDKQLWKIQLFFLEYAVYTVQLIANISNEIWVRFKQIFTYQEFYRKQYCKYETGELVNTENSKVTPLINGAVQLFRKVQKNRQKFEDTPDDQFLKKKYGRVWNIIQNYVFLFFFGSIFTYSFLLPILISALVVVEAVILILCPVLCLVFLILQRAFCIVFYDFYNPQHADFINPFPIFAIIVQVLIGLGQVIIQLFLVVFDIIRIVLHSILAILRFIVLHIYGFCTYNTVIKCLGRVPVSESSVAYRIAGPGVGTKKFFYTLSEQDVELLVRAQMEKIQLENYRKFVELQIQKPRTDSIDLINKIILQPYQDNCIKNVNFDFQESSRKEQILQQILSIQIEERKKLFPSVQSLQKVRFKDAQLQKHLKNSQNIVNQFVQSGTDEEQLAQITQNILIKIFQNKDIVKPLKEDDWQFELQEVVKNLDVYQKTIKNNLKGGKVKNVNFGISSSSSSYNYVDDDSDDGFKFGKGKMKRRRKINPESYANTEDEDDKNLKYISWDTLKINYIQSQVSPLAINFQHIINKLEQEKREREKQ